MTKSHFSHETHMKVCFKCKINKNIYDFYIHPKMKDKHLNKCIECTKLDVRKRRFGPKRESILAYDRQRGGRQSYEYQKEYKQKNALKYKAHILSQRIPREPCEVCGSVKNVHRHHDDYNKPMHVRFLCAQHHSQHHAKEKELK